MDQNLTLAMLLAITFSCRHCTNKYRATRRRTAGWWPFWSLHLPSEPKDVIEFVSVSHSLADHHHPVIFQSMPGSLSPASTASLGDVSMVVPPGLKDHSSSYKHRSHTVVLQSNRIELQGFGASYPLLRACRFRNRDYPQCQL